MPKADLRTKLAVSFGAIVLLFLVQGGFALWNSRAVDSQVDEIDLVRIPSLAGLNLMQNNLNKVLRSQRTLLIPGISPDYRKTLLEQVETARAEYQKGMDIYAPLPQTKQEAASWNRFLGLLEEGKILNDRFFGLESSFNQSRDPTVMKLMLDLTQGSIRDNNRELMSLLDEIVAINVQVAHDASANAASISTTAQWAAWLAMACGALVAVVLAWATGGYLVRNTRALTDYSNAVAAGELDAQLSVTARDEFGTLADGLKHMVRDLKTKIDECNHRERQAEDEAVKARQAAEQARQAMLETEAKQREMLEAASRLEHVVETMTSATTQLEGQVLEVGQGVESQANRTAETATAMQEMNATVLEVARNAAQAASQASMAREQALEGQSIVSRAQAAITQVNSVAGHLEDSMGQLGEHAQSIGRIMTVISDIADQTNLLALNAAIEAARAGDAGRGFAVVADEVRKLAEKTMNATGEVGQAITTIQDGIGSNITLVKQAAQAATEATAEAEASGKALGQIVELVNDTGQQINSIAAASQEQSAASEQINRAVDEVSRIATEISQGMNEATGAVDGISAESRELTALIASFRNNGGEKPALQ